MSSYLRDQTKVIHQRCREADPGDPEYDDHSRPTAIAAHAMHAASATARCERVVMA
jgi:hypothetical protein